MSREYSSSEEVKVQFIEYSVRILRQKIRLSTYDSSSEKIGFSVENMILLRLRNQAQCNVHSWL
jgi:hypothetical protein